MARGKRKAKKEDSLTVSLAHVEQTFRNEALEQEEIATLHPPVRIHIHSKRKRFVDADGISAKAAIDGLVHAGILPDDSASYVHEVSYSQEKSTEEETIIEIWEKVDV